MSKSQKVGGGCKKLGRNKAKCALYKAQGRREKNKLKKLLKLQKKHFNDKCLQKAINGLI
jgi:hypothetical protein